MNQKQADLVLPRFAISEGLPEYVADLRSRVFGTSTKAAAYFMIRSHSTILRYEKQDGPDLIHPPVGYVAALITLLYEKQANSSNAAELQEHLLYEYKQVCCSNQGFEPAADWQALLKQAEDYTLQTRFENLSKHRVPQPGSVVGFSRRPQLLSNPLFVGRNKELIGIARWMSQKSDAGTLTYLISGMGGLGKSQLALEVMYRYGPYFSGGVFWLNAADRHQLQNEIALCGGEQHLNLRPDFAQLPLSERTQLVMAEWSKDIPRLLIFDNCEDEQLLAQWRPIEGGCRILVTSRRSSWNPALSIEQLQLDVLDEADSIALLARYRPDLAEEEQRPLLAKFAYLVGYLPLALHLVGSYLHLHKEQAPELYLQELEKSYALAHASLQDHDRHYSPTAHPQHIARMIELSFAHIAADGLAVKLMQIFAYAAPGEVMQRFVIDACLPEFDPASITSSLKQLAALALIRLQEEDGSVWMHRLIVDFILLNHPAEAIRSQLEAGIDQLITAQYQDQAQQVKILQQLEAQLRWLADKILGRSDRQAGMVVYWLAYHLWLQMTLDEGEQYLQQLQELFQHADNHNELRMLSNIYELRGLYVQVRGKFVEAGVCHKECLDIRTELLEPEHPDVATAHNNLGFACYAYHDLSEGEANLVLAVHIRHRIHGLKHHNTARSINNLAYIYFRQGRWRRAERYFKLAFMLRTYLKTSEYERLQGKIMLVNVALEQGYYDKARSLIQEILGQPRPERGRILFWYSEALWRLAQIELVEGRIDRAFDYLQQAYSCFMEIWSTSNAEVLDLQVDIAKVFMLRGDYQRARELLDEIADEISAQFGDKHFWMLRVYETYTQLELAQGHAQAAEQFAQHYLYVSRNCTADQHPRIARAHQLVANTLAAQKRLAEAKEQITLAYDLAQQRLKPSHPWFVAIQNEYQTLSYA